MPTDQTPEEKKKMEDQKPAHGGRYRSANKDIPKLQSKHMWVTIDHNDRTCRYILEKLQEKNGLENWKVIGRNGHLLLSNNRPILLKHNLKHRQPEWKLQEGRSINDRSFYEKLVKAIEKFIQRNPGL